MSDASDTPSSAPKLRGTRLGIVTGAKCDKTRSVSVARQIKHPKYGKIIKRKSSIQVHDPLNASHVGDHVEIINCRPISKTKSWRLVRIVQAGPDSGLRTPDDSSGSPTPDSGLRTPDYPGPSDTERKQ